MKLTFCTLTLDSMPYISWHLPSFNRLQLDWHWVIAHGVAANKGSTRWCKQLEPRLSLDGTTEYLQEIRHHPRVTILEKSIWEGGKDEMVQACTDTIKDECLLVEVDSDEHWESTQIKWLYDLLTPQAGVVNYGYNCARFFFRYYIGQNLVTCVDDSWGQNPGEFLRAWIFRPGMKWASHEPPKLLGVNEPGQERCASRELTRAVGIVPEHYGYAFESQAAFKSRYYGGHEAALSGWHKLQNYTGPFPIKLKKFFPWVDDRAQADLLHKTTQTHIRNSGDGQP
jgi:hypothetical protein